MAGIQSRSLSEMVLIIFLAILCVFSPVSAANSTTTELCTAPCINGPTAGQCSDGASQSCTCTINGYKYYYGDQCERVNMNIPKRIPNWYSIEFIWPEPPQMYADYSFVYISYPYAEYMNISIHELTMDNDRKTVLWGLLPMSTLYTICVMNTTEAWHVVETQNHGRVNSLYLDCVDEHTRFSFALYVIFMVLVAALVLCVFCVIIAIIYAVTKCCLKKRRSAVTSQPVVVYTATLNADYPKADYYIEEKNGEPFPSFQP